MRHPTLNTVMDPRQHARAGGLLLNCVLLLGLAVLAVFVVFYISSAVRAARQCEAQLLRIYQALEQYEMERGQLPALAFYPNDPREGPDSLRGQLERYGIDFDSCSCPSSPKVLREAGQTYLWNAALSGNPMPRGGEPVWMLVEMLALSADVPAPHWNGYHVLYSDGKVRSTHDPVKQLPGL